jgi:hypothetical protein
VTVTGEDDEGTEASDDDDHTITATDVAPEITVEKTVSPDLVQAGTATVTYTYKVQNTSDASTDDKLTLNSLIDDRGTADAGDDVDILALYTSKSGDGNGNGFIDFGETWTFTWKTDVHLNPGASLTNTVTATGTDDDGSTATATDDATVTAFAGPGVRTPGFWSNNGLQFWDGNGDNQKTGISFPNGELLKGINYLILGGDHDNVLEAGELQVSRTDALAFLNASQKQQQDGRWMLVRDAVATELNIRAGNPAQDSDPNTFDPQQGLDEAVKWLNQYGDSAAGATNNDILTQADLTGSAKVGTSTANWTTVLSGYGHSAADLHTQLDVFNNTGSFFGKQYANNDDFLV